MLNEGRISKSKSKTVITVMATVALDRTKYNHRVHGVGKFLYYCSIGQTWGQGS